MIFGLEMDDRVRRFDVQPGQIGSTRMNLFCRCRKIDHYTDGLALFILRCGVYFACLIAMPCAAAAQPFVNKSDAGKPGMVVLNSYHPGYSWSDAEQEGILQALQSRPEVGWVAVDYLDSKHHAFSDYLDAYKRLMAFKYRKNPPAVVIVLDDPALEFVVQYAKDIFPGAAIVFCGINDFKPGMLKGLKNITGVAQNMDPGGHFGDHARAASGIKRRSGHQRRHDDGAVFTQRNGQPGSPICRPYQYYS